MTKIRHKQNGNNVVFAHSNITFQITNKSNHFMPYCFATTFYIHVKQATLNKDIGRSHPFSKL
jgi:predicted amino acid dehydrogenase